MRHDSSARPWFQLALACGCAMLAVAWPDWGSALRAETTYDHLQCLQVKDPLRLKGLVDISSRFGDLSGCKISQSAYLCTPAAKTAAIVSDGNTPIDPLPVTGSPVLREHICYKVRCPEPDAVDNTIATDQFGPRRLTRMKTRLLCAPTAESAAECQTACCYLYAPSVYWETGCLQYTGTAEQVSAFVAQCNRTNSQPYGYVYGIGQPGACTASPASGVACVVGQTRNAGAVPTDSRCGG